MNVALRAGLMALCALALQAQSGAPEPLSDWPYFKELKGPGGLTEIVLDREVLDKARNDQADLRLYDAAHKEIPYGLRVRREEYSRSIFEGKQFNRSVEGNAALIRLKRHGSAMRR